jgi:aspartate aminotransferase
MKTLSPSPTTTINALASKKRMNGERVYNFSAGDPILDNHPSIAKGALQQIEKKCLPYPPVEGISELRRLAAEWVNNTCKTHYAKENVMVTCGGKFALFSCIYSLLEPGDEVLIHAPYWVSYPEIVKMGGGIPKIIHNGWKLTPNDLLQHASKNTKMIIFNNACNPTGIIYNKQEIQEILNTAHTLNLKVISDEVYSGLVYESSFISCGSFPEYHERVIIIQSCSKNFGMTGWRVGFALGPEKIIKTLAGLQSQSTTGVCSVSQWAAIGALENHAEVNTYVKKAMKDRRDLFTKTFNSLFPTPLDKIPSSLYAFVPLEAMGISTKDSTMFCEKLISLYNIALVPGTAFGTEGYVRFAFSETEQEIAEALHALKRVVGEES